MSQDYNINKSSILSDCYYFAILLNPKGFFMKVKNISPWAGNISLIHSIPKSYDMVSYQLISCCSTESQDFNINMSSILPDCYYFAILLNPKGFFMKVKNISHWAGNISLIHSIPNSYVMASTLTTGNNKLRFN